MKTLTSTIAALATIDAARIGTAADSRVSFSSISSTVSESQRTMDTAHRGYRSLAPQAIKSGLRSLAPIMNWNPIDFPMLSRSSRTGQRPGANFMGIPDVDAVSPISDIFRAMPLGFPVLATMPPTNEDNEESDVVETIMPIIDDTGTTPVTLRTLAASQIGVRNLSQTPSKISPGESLSIPTNSAFQGASNVVHESFKNIE